MDAITTPPAPVNEPNLNYAPGSPERTDIENELVRLSAAGPIDLTATIGGRKVMGGGAEIQVVLVRRPGIDGDLGRSGRRVPLTEVHIAAQTLGFVWLAVGCTLLLLGGVIQQHR